MDLNKIKELHDTLLIFQQANVIHPTQCITAPYVNNATEAISLIVIETENIYPALSKALDNCKNALFMYDTKNRVYYINPIALGKTLAYLELIYDSETTESPINEWIYIHPLIVKASKKSFIGGNYAESAANAFIEINDRVKKIFRICSPNADSIPDGVTAMNAVFSEQSPKIEVCDRTTDTGENIHNGTRFMLAGAMSALRNPKSHSNDEQTTVTRTDAMRRLMFASLLMYKIDDAVKHSQINE